MQADFRVWGFAITGLGGLGFWKYGCESPGREAH